MANTPPSESLTLRRHRRQRFRQILLPIFLVVALAVTVAVLTLRAGASQARLWADVSIIWLIAPMLVFALLCAVILGFLIYGVFRLTQVTPRYTSRVQDFASRVNAGTHQVTAAVLKPFVWLKKIGAALESFFRSSQHEE